MQTSSSKKLSKERGIFFHTKDIPLKTVNSSAMETDNQDQNITCLLDSNRVVSHLDRPLL